jgi:hypothetical protein
MELPASKEQHVPLKRLAKGRSSGL